jgi:hypothetical protein
VKNIAELAAAAVCGLTVGMGVVFIWDCRRTGGEVQDCWLTGQNMVNRAVDVGLGGGAGFLAGFWTLNPKLDDKRKKGQAEGDPLDPRPH